MSDDLPVVQSPVTVAVSRDQTGALEARIRAEVGARAALAIARPRDLDVARERLLRDCRRPAFAESAEYAVPRGGTTIRGASIRMAEAVARALGNLDVQVVLVAEDDERRIMEAVVCDLETNTVWRQAFSVRRVVERRRLPPGARAEDVVGQRVGADGQVLYLIRASEADLMMSQQAAASRVLRGLILRICPGDILEEAITTARETRERGTNQDPAAARKRILDAFAGIGVSASDLKAHLGHPLEQCSPAEIEALRGLYAAIRDGQTTWAEATRQRDAPEAESPAVQAAAERARAATSKSPASTARWAGLAYLAPGRDREEIDAAARGAALAVGGASDPAAWTEQQWRAAEDAVKAIGHQKTGEV